MVFSADEGLEEAPRPTRDPAQFATVRGCQRLRARVGPRRADRSHDRWRESPEQDEWRRSRPRRGVRNSDDDGGTHGDDQRAHRPRQERHGVGTWTGAGRRRRDPLQEVAARDVEADDRAYDRVDHQTSLVREKCTGESHLREPDGEVRGHRARMRPLRDPSPPGNDSQQSG